ncbi:MAG TPA: type II toxin-antitoxin system Phd/YefM family antitoxin [Thermoflexia bacterium]|nr:type II toxin-antitoxin system Phd/YefM family antitoxin [Thermoflexia bacterium]
MIEKRIGARDARAQFADLLGRIGYGGEIVVVERFGKPMAAMIPPDLYQRLAAEREARFESLARLRVQLPDLSGEEVLVDVAAAVNAVRVAHAEDRS